ncbi:putative amidoligase enzyme-domain-containing protein [Annulohypoxylon truncatum]|uniref:putative amidoligase enzyme-domain-containing protein n=1 Tax=Annulohypoxylon truncatum TaxID=327061 RepID=UPI0020086E6A|nr:putative amidoligase enzyme-domain-containing protein [Annulohypoxylon truncatum]KAI1215085.1 putative amidoligase enzyme-domain-containing protein [Annulohypoxylon truncatum]
MAALTFGVELEAAYFYTRKSEELENAADDLPPMVDMTYDAWKERNPKIPRCEYYKKCERDDDMARLLTYEIHQFVGGLPKDLRGEPIPPTGNPLQDSYRGWKVEADLSIKLDEEDHDGLEYTGLEVISPAMYAAENAFREVKAVTDWLRKAFRAAVPPSCGLHVHVGQGPALFPLETLQKLAAVCWAGDTLLQQMHPVSRRFNDHCLGPRVKSNLAEGDKVENYHTANDDFSVSTMKKLLSKLVASRWEAGARTSVTTTTTTPSIQNVINLGKARRLMTKGFTRTLPRTKHAVMPSKEERDVCDRPIYSINIPDEPFELRQGHDIMTGTTEIFRCLNLNAVASLMSSTARGAYNFENYLDIKRNAKDGPYEAANKTVEFRQAAASLDGHWVATYARICVGMTRFAQDARMPDLWRLVYECHLAEKSHHIYDVLDLLLDLGLPTEAKVVQNRLQKGAHVAEMLKPFLSGADCLACNHLHELMQTDRRNNDLPFELIDQSKLQDYWGKCGQW